AHRGAVEKAHALDLDHIRAGREVQRGGRRLGWLALLNRQQPRGRFVALGGHGFAEALQALHVLRSEEHTSELQSRENLVCRLLPRARPLLVAYTTLFRSRHTGARWRKRTRLTSTTSAPGARFSAAAAGLGGLRS